MAAPTTSVDSAFNGAGKQPGLEIWRIENFCPVPLPKASYGKFFTGDSYIVLKTTELDGGAYQYDIHYWLGKDTSQDEAGTVALKTIELDESLGGGAVQHREVQGEESEKFLKYFPHCIIPQKGGVASGFKHTEINKQKHETRMFICKVTNVVHVKEVPIEVSSLNHGDIFILDTETKIYQFNGSKSSISERAKAFDVVQHLKDTNHEGTCDHVIIKDDEAATEDEAAEFWSFFGGFSAIVSDC